MKKKSFPITNIGSAALLTVFIILCLVTFAILSLSSAASDYQYSETAADYNTEYYEACNEATLKLGEIDNILSTAYENNPQNYFSVVSSSLSEMDGLSLDFESVNPKVSFETEINDSRLLEVTLTINPPDNLSDGFYYISSWQEASSTEWEGDDSLKLLE